MKSLVRHFSPYISSRLAQFQSAVDIRFLDDCTYLFWDVTRIKIQI